MRAMRTYNIKDYTFFYRLALCLITHTMSRGKFVGRIRLDFNKICEQKKSTHSTFFGFLSKHLFCLDICIRHNVTSHF